MVTIVRDDAKRPSFPSFSSIGKPICALLLPRRAET